MEFAPTNNLDQLLPEPGVKTNPAASTAGVEEDQFERHLQPSAESGSTADPPTDESPPEEIEAGSHVPSPNENEKNATDESETNVTNENETNENVTEGSTEPESSQDAGHEESPETEVGRDQITESATSIEEAEPNSVAQASTNADNVKPVVAAANTGQDIKTPEISGDATDQSTNRRADTKPNHDTLAKSEMPQDGAEKTSVPTTDEQAGATPPAEEPAEEPAKKPPEASPQSSGDSKTSSRKRSREHGPSIKPSSKEFKSTAEPNNNGQQVKSEQWIELPESGSKEHQLASNTSEVRGTADGNSPHGDAKVDAVQNRLREAPSARQTDGMREAGELNRVEQTRLVQRVSRAVESAQQRGGPLRLRLSPPELGSLRLEVTVEKGVLSAKIEAESQMARAVLLDNLPQLRDRLSEQGIQIDNFDVDVNDQPTDDTQHPTRDADNQAGQSTNQSRADNQQLEEHGIPTEKPIDLSKGKLNVVV